MRLDRWFGRIALAVAALICAPGQQPGWPEARATPARIVVLADIEGPIGPATVRHVEQAIARSAERGATALVLRINTPGGLADSMREIVSAILGSAVPVVGYVAPPGAHAASAGTYIVYATHLAAMAPGTNLGAATPVQIGGGLPGAPPERGPDRGEPGGAPREAGDEPEADAKGSASPRAPQPDPMTAKSTNDAVALIRSLAELNGRNADWAERAVRDAASLSSGAALEMGVIDLVAADLDDLLESADGRQVTLKGEPWVLATDGAGLESFAPDGMTRLLSTISNPNVALILLMIGIYGIIFEFWNPGSVGPGVIGAISLTLGLYALNQLPLDYAGLALVILGVVFMVAESLTPAFGILGFGGIAAFVLGSAMLIDTDVPAYQVSWWVIGTMAALSAAVLSLLLGYTVKIYRRPPAGSHAGLAGSSARVIDWSGDEGHVWFRGERWRATGRRGFAPGDLVEVMRLDGLTMVVGKAANGGGDKAVADDKGDDS